MTQEYMSFKTEPECDTCKRVFKDKFYHPVLHNPGKCNECGFCRNHCTCKMHKYIEEQFARSLMTKNTVANMLHVASMYYGIEPMLLNGETADNPFMVL